MKTHIDLKFTSAKQLINNLLGNLPETISLNRVIVENKISSELEIQAGQQTLVSIIDGLVTAIIRNARNTRICVTAERFIDTIILKFEDPNNYNGYALSFSLMALVSLVRTIGGDISVEGIRKSRTVVSLSFPYILTYDNITVN